MRRVGAGLGSGGFVVYDDTGGTIAARLWWMLRDVGHEAVRVLDGGIDAWSAAGHPLNTDAPDMISTSPMMLAFGATHASGATFGDLPRKT